MYNARRLIPYTTRFVIVVFWAAVIVALLYIPRLSQQWHGERTLTILSWGGIFDSKVLAQFTAQTGIKVNVSFYLTNEELLVYLRTTKGKGYDILVPSDYAIKQLKEDGLIKKIDKTRLTFLSRLNPNLMGYSFDPYNDFALPYMVELFGLAYDKDFFKNWPHNPGSEPSWEWLFTFNGFKIVMVNDPIEAVALAAQYLYNRVPSYLEATDIEKIKNLLLAQRTWVEAYSDFRPDYYLLTKNCPLVVTAYSGYLRALKLNPHINFVLPRDGTFLSIENLAISAASQLDEEVYQFLNYIYTPVALKENFELLSALPATVNSGDKIRATDEIQALLQQPRNEFVDKVLFFAPIMPERLLHDLWIAVKS